MENDPVVTLRLPSNYVGQLLDGLDVLIEDWDYTAAFLATGEVDSDKNLRDATDADEATGIANFYRQIRDAIWEQIEK